MHAHTEHVTTETQTPTFLNSLALGQVVGSAMGTVHSHNPLLALYWGPCCSLSIIPAILHHFLLVSFPLQSTAPGLIRHLNS